MQDKLGAPLAVKKYGMSASYKLIYSISVESTNKRFILLVLGNSSSFIGVYDECSLWNHGDSSFEAVSYRGILNTT